MVRGMSVEDIELAVVTGVDAYATRGSLGEKLASDDGMAAALERHVDGAGERKHYPVTGRKKQSGNCGRLRHLPFHGEKACGEHFRQMPCRKPQPVKTGV